MLALCTTAHSPAHVYCDQFADLSSKPCTEVELTLRGYRSMASKVATAACALPCVESSRAPLNATLSSALAARRDAQRSGALRVEL